MMAALDNSVGFDRRFPVENSPWSIVAWRRLMREVVRTLRA